MAKAELKIIGSSPARMGGARRKVGREQHGFPSPAELGG